MMLRRGILPGIPVLRRAPFHTCPGPLDLCALQSGALLRLSHRAVL